MNNITLDVLGGRFILHTLPFICRAEWQTVSAGFNRCFFYCLLGIFLFFSPASETMAGTSAKNSFPRDIQRIKDRGCMTVAMFYQDRPPFFYVNEQGKLAGIDVDLARDIAQWLDVDVVFDREARSFDGVVDRVVTGRADMAVSKLSMTMSRAMRVAFTQPYIAFHHALLVNRMHLADFREGNRKKTSLELMQSGNPRIGVRGPSSWNGYAQRLFPNAEIITREDLEQLVNSAATGKLFAVMYDEFEMKSVVNKRPELNINLDLLVLDDYIDPIGIAVSADDHHLLVWLDFYLRYGHLPKELKEMRKEFGLQILTN